MALGVSRRGCGSLLDRAARSHYATASQTLRETIMKRIPLLCDVLLTSVVGGRGLDALAGCNGSPRKSRSTIASLSCRRASPMSSGSRSSAARSGPPRPTSRRRRASPLKSSGTARPRRATPGGPGSRSSIRKAARAIQGCLVLAPQDSKAMVPSVEQCVAANIAVVVIDSGLDEAVLKEKPDLIVKYVATDNFHGGWLAAEELVKVLEKEGKKEPRLILFLLSTRLRKAPTSRARKASSNASRSSTRKRARRSRSSLTTSTPARRSRRRRRKPARS